MSNLYVSPHFSWLEFMCHDGTPVPVELLPNVRRLCDTVLEPLRSRWGQPLIITSGYHSHRYNEALRAGGHGAAEFSRHLTAEAADVRPTSLGMLTRLEALIETMLKEGQLQALGGYGVYPQWVHLDVRPRGSAGHIARWKGAGVASEP